jgi:hypothetical protein
LNVDRTGAEALCGTKRIFFNAGTINHPDPRFRCKLSNSLQALVVERRENRLIQIIVMAESEQELDLDPWL